MKERKIEYRYCQSCGMPSPEYTDLFYATNKDRSHNEEYCFYRIKNGEFTVDVALERMISEWVKHIHRYNL